MFNEVGIQRQHALSVYCTPAAVLAYNQWVSYPMRNLFENQYGTSVTSVMSAFSANLVEKNLFPLGVFDVRAVVANGQEDDAFFVSVNPAADNWHALLSEQLRDSTGIERATLVDQSGNYIDRRDVSKLIATHTQLFTVAVSDEIEQPAEEIIGVKITKEMPVDQQLSVYAKALAKRVYVSNNVADLQHFVDSRNAAVKLAITVSKNKGLDAVLELAFSGRRVEFYARVAAYIRSNVRTAISVLKNTKSPVDMLRRVFVEEFEDVSFQDWIESALVDGSGSDVEEEESSSEDEVIISDNIDCEYDSYSDLMDSEEEESQLGAKFSALKKAARNVVSRSKYVSFKLERTAQESTPQAFSWLGTTTLEPGDIIRTVVHAAKKEKSKLSLLKRKKNKKVKELPTSAIVDFQMRNRRAPSSPWLTVQTVEVLLPDVGTIDGPMFAVPLDDQAFRVVVSTRRPGAGWQMVDVEGEYEFNVDAFGTKGASRRNYPVTWEQVRNVRYNQELRARYNVPEFVFRARLVDTEPKPFKRKLTGEIVDYFDAGEQQRIEDARQASMQEQRDEGVQTYFDKMQQRVAYKAYAINEVRHVIWALNNNMRYESEFLRGTAEYDSEYNEAMAASIDARIDGKKKMTAQQRLKKQMALGRPAEKEMPVDAKYVTVPVEPKRREEISEDTAARFGAGVRFARPNAGRRITADTPSTSTRARFAPAVVSTTTPVATPPTPVVTVTPPPAAVVVEQKHIDANKKYNDDLDDMRAIKVFADTAVRAATTPIKNALSALYAQIAAENIMPPASTVDASNIDAVKANLKKLKKIDFNGLVSDVWAEFNTLLNASKKQAVGLAAANKSKQPLVRQINGRLDEVSEKEAGFLNDRKKKTARDLAAALDVLVDFIDQINSSASSSSSVPPPTPVVPNSSGAATSGTRSPAPISLAPAASSSSVAPVPISLSPAAPPSPIASRVGSAKTSIDALFAQLDEEENKISASIVEDAIDYVVMSGEAIVHSFDKMISVLINKRNPIFVQSKRYIILMPDENVWKRYMSAFKLGTADVSTFLHDYTFEVLPGGLFAHSRRVSLTSLSGRNTAELKRTYDKDRNITTIQLRALDGRRYAGTLDTHAYSSDYKIHSVKLNGWTGFSS